MQEARAERPEEITVTGSRIERETWLGSSPVGRIDAMELEYQGTTRIEDMLRTFPQLYTPQSGGRVYGATGTATLDLRNLGSVRTLVLVNGRRMPAGSPLGSSSPDINQIPAAMVESVEILTGGASATYGSDALAGVVNFLLKDNFEGVQMEYQFSQYYHDNDNSRWQRIVTDSGFSAPSGTDADGEISNWSLIGGVSTSDKRGNITGYATYRNVNAVFQGDRDYSSCLFTNDLGGCAGSSTIPQGRFTNFRGAGDPVAFDYLVVGDEFVARDGRVYNFAPTNHYQRPDERYTVGAFAHYDFSQALEAYAEFMYMDDRSKAQIAPSGSFFHIDGLKCDNPLLSAQQRDAICTNAADDVVDGVNERIRIGRRSVETGDRFNELNHNSYRIVLGLRGDLDETWHYDASAQYSEVEMRNTYRNDLSIRRIQRAVDVVRNTDGDIVCQSTLLDTDDENYDPDCVPWNIFREGGVTEEAANYIRQPLRSKGTTEQTVVSAFVTGDLDAYDVRLPMAQRAISVVLGAEYRKESLEFDPDENYRTGDGAGQGGASPPVSGSYDVEEFFAEASVPIVEGLDYAQALVFDTAYRYSKYSYGESTDTFALRLDWEVNPSLRFRGSYQRAVRGANVQELFLPVRGSLFDLTRDPCGGPIGADGTTQSGATFEQCARTGVTAEQWGNIQHSPAGQYNFITGGNTELVPEIGKTWSFGVVLTPDFSPGLSLTVDYYRIRIEQGISVLNPRFILLDCLSGHEAVCGFINRHSQRGDLWIGSGTDNGHIVALSDNLVVEKTTGVDVMLDASLDLGELGSLDLQNALAYVENSEFQQFQGAPTIKCAGKYICGPTPEVRNRMRVTWDTPWGVSASAMWRYIDQLEGREDTVDIRKMNYFDLTASWEFADSLQIRVGVNNILDKEPPIVGITAGPSTGGTGNTFPALYDSLGRYGFVSIRASF